MSNTKWITLTASAAACLAPAAAAAHTAYLPHGAPEQLAGPGFVQPWLAARLQAPSSTGQAAPTQPPPTTDTPAETQPTSPEPAPVETAAPPSPTADVQASLDKLQADLRKLQARVDTAESALRVQEDAARRNEQINNVQGPPLGFNAWTSGNAMATRVTFAIADDNLLAGAADRSPALGFKLAADRLFYDAIEQRKRGFETETQLVVYKRVPTYFKRMDAEAAFVVNLQHYTNDKTYRTDTQIRDYGSYVKLNWYTKRNDYQGDNVSVTMFPFDSQRFLLGYTYNITWGGERIFPNNAPGGDAARSNSMVPGLRLRYDFKVGTGKDGYVFFGAKTARLLNEQLNEPQTYYGLLGGYGLSFTRWLAWEVNGGYFQRGAFPPQGTMYAGIGGKTAQAFGGSTRLTFRYGMPIGTSIDFQLYRYSPDATYLLTQNQMYDNRIAGSAAFEFTGVGQTLLDWEKPDTVVIRPAMAGAFNGRLRIKKVRLFGTALFRNLDYVVLDIPGVAPYRAFPAGAIVKPEWFIVAGVDYYLPRTRLTPGFVFAYKNPASYTSNGTTLVYREYWDVETLPNGIPTAYDILSSKLTLKWDIAPFFVLVSELRYTHDSNRTKFVKSDDDAGRVRVFEDANITNRLGFFLLTQARW
ncbi:MAG: hypothetical protein JNL82_34285 [Myxococcales bacterium]|nr:hypothetical protein [Myxococcales bacterium]